MSKRKLPPRAERRAAARDDAKLARDRERLARLEAGGTAARPIELESASQVDVHASSLRCPRCDGPSRIDEHAAVTVDDMRLRQVRLRCARCGARRDVWFRIVTALPS